MLKAIIFDFDGVIVESVEVKIDAFRRLFEGFPKHLDEIIEYHTINGGISRYVKFQHIYEKILKKPLSQEESQRLGRLFSEYALDGVLKAPFVAGAEEFLLRHHRQIQFFVVSGTPEDEVRLVVEKRRLAGFFKGVYGSPRSKADLSRMILKDNHLAKEDVVSIGDSINDYEGAQGAGVRFVGRIHPKEEIPFGTKVSFPVIKDLTEFEPWLRQEGLL